MRIGYATFAKEPITHIHEMGSEANVGESVLGLEIGKKRTRIGPLVKAQSQLSYLVQNPP